MFWKIFLCSYNKLGELGQVPIHTMDDEKHNCLISVLFTDRGLLQRDWWWLCSSTPVYRGETKKSGIIEVDSAPFEHSSPWSTCCHVPLKERVTSKRGCFWVQKLHRTTVEHWFFSIFPRIQKYHWTCGEERTTCCFFPGVFCCNFSLNLTKINL